EKKPADRRAFLLRAIDRSPAAEIHMVVLYHDVVTDPHVGRLALRDGSVATIIQPHDDLERIALPAAVRSDRVPGESAGHRAADGRGRAAVALADLVAQCTTDHRADHGAQGSVAVVALDVDL